MLEYCQF